MPSSELYDSNPRSYAVELIEDEGIDAKSLLVSCLKFMSSQDVKDMLDDNELSPRFRVDQEDADEDGDDDGFCGDEISSEERNACDHCNERHTYPDYD